VTLEAELSEQPLIQTEGKAVNPTLFTWLWLHFSSGKHFSSHNLRGHDPDESESLIITTG
jgi:hypothetical protein